MPQARRSGSGSSSRSSRSSSGGGQTKRSSSGRSGSSRSSSGRGRSSGSSSGRGRSSSSGRGRSSSSSSTRARSASSGRSTRSSGSARSPEAALDAAAKRLRKLNERIIEAGRDAGESTLSSYERVLKTIATTLERGPGSSDVEWISQLATTQAKFIREVTTAWTSAARNVLK